MIRRAGLALALTCLASCLAQDEPAKPSLGVGHQLEVLRAAAYAPQRLKERRQRLLASLPPGAVVVVASPPPADDTWTYRPAPDFLYLSGLYESSTTLVIAKGLDAAFAPARNHRYELWNGERLAPGTPRAEQLGFGDVLDKELLSKRVRRLLAREGAQLYVSGTTSAALGVAGRASKSAKSAIAALRQVKDEAEVELLTHAIDATGAALSEAIRSIRPGLYEFEVQGVIEYLFQRYGAQRTGFASIVGSGPNSCVLHYTRNRRQLQDGDMVVMDVGAEVFGYSADVTRTVPVSGRFSKRQRQIYEIVLRAQQAAIDAIEPGVTVRAVHRAAASVIQEAGYRSAFPHTTSHWLGLDVHDVGDYSRALEPGMVLTVEPGIYLPKENLGVRIEDDVLVTKTGHRVLSIRVPRGVDELEALLKGDGLGTTPVAPLRLGPKTAPSAGPRRF